MLYRKGLSMGFSSRCVSKRSTKIKLKIAVFFIYQLKGRLTQSQTISPKQDPNADPGIGETFHSRLSVLENRFCLHMYYVLITMCKIKKDGEFGQSIWKL